MESQNTRPTAAPVERFVMHSLPLWSAKHFGDLRTGCFDPVIIQFQPQWTKCIADEVIERFDFIEGACHRIESRRTDAVPCVPGRAIRQQRLDDLLATQKRGSMKRGIRASSPQTGIRNRFRPDTVSDPTVSDPQNGIRNRFRPRFKEQPVWPPGSLVIPVKNSMSRGCWKSHMYQDLSLCCQKSSGVFRCADGKPELTEGAHHVIAVGRRQLRACAAPVECGRGTRCGDTCLWTLSRACSIGAGAVQRAGRKVPRPRRTQSRTPRPGAWLQPRGLK